MEGVCRVCLADDRKTYRVANTALEQTYDVVTSVKLQRADRPRPTALCCVCVSQLRRCRRFIETARESNDALDRWYTHTDGKLTARPLFSFTKTKTQCVDFWEPQVKQEPEWSTETDPGDAGAFIMGKIKHEVTCDYVETDLIHVSHEDNDNTQTFDDEQDKAQISADKVDHKQISDEFSDDEKECRDVKSNISEWNVEWVNNVQNCVDVKNDKIQASDDVKLEIPEVLDDVGSETNPCTWNVALNQDSASTSLNSQKRIKLDRDMTDGPAVKQRRPISARHRPVNTDATSTPQLQRNMFSCSQCTYTTAKKSYMKQHSMEHAGVKPFSCDQCNNKFSRKYHLKRHLMTHTGYKPFACDKCDYKTGQKRDLKQHLLIHTDDKPFACNNCDYKCNQKGNLKRHLMTHSDEKPFACDKCDYKCVTKNHLKRHLMIHTGEKLFACDKCDFRSNAKSNLKCHLIIHTGERPFACDKCEYKCYQNSDLKRHFKTHSNEKLFACDKCSFRSNARSSLRSHLIIHTGERPFACDKCDYRCNVKNNLKKHLFIHTGQKPFACDKCDYKCNVKNNLKNHLNTHNSEKPCDVFITK